jgi:hypothetical protein
MVALHPVNTRFFDRCTAEDVSTADDDCNLNAYFGNSFDFFGVSVKNVEIDNLAFKRLYFGSGMMVM